MKSAKNITALRENWEVARNWDTSLLREMSVFESVGDLEALYREFRSTLEETDHLFREERFGHLQELQDRLRALGRGKKGNSSGEPD